MAASAFDHLKATYFQECAELVDSVYVHLTAIEEDRRDDDSVHAIFRAIHSIKGGGGAFGFDRLVGFAHVLETLLDLLRDNKIVFSREIAALLLRAADVLSDLIAAERDAQPLALGFEDGLRQQLERAIAADPAAPARAAAAPTPAPAAASAAQPYRIRFRPRASLFRSANEPLLLIRELKRLGPLTVVADLDRLPPLPRMDPEDAYLAWTIELVTDATVARIEEIFEFVADQCELSIEAAPAEADRPSATDATAQGPAPPAAEMPPGLQDGGADAAKPDLHGAHPADASAAPPTVRVDVEKIDRLVNLVGELVINQAMLVQLGGLLPPDLSPGLISGLETLSQHLRELQDGVMAIRTQPVRSVFSRMPRLVRELSAQLGKEARLVITGEGTEIDKTVIEQLADPLTHLLRNALDHGIEAPDRRVASGKPPHGTIRLAAEHRSSRIMIEVSDDGNGIDRGRVLARARERGLVAAGAAPSEEEIDNLIFVPGFTTADVVSNVSGRGVGMDVVRRNIQSLGGRIVVQSRSGGGSRFILSLPLTLAILDGMIVAVWREFYIVPLTNIVESLRPKRADIHSVVGCGDVVAIRGEYVPLFYLAQHFNVPDAGDDPARGIVVVVENESKGQLGLVVDELVGQQQVVVKSLEANYGAVAGIGGATILGNGCVALILDISGLRDLPAVAGPPRSAMPAGALTAAAAHSPTLQ